MARKYEALRGMEDILPGEVEKWQWIEEKARIFFEARGFKEIRTPLLEPTELFRRSVGEASDIVHKEMFSFKDRGDREVSLRPEMTASVARAVIEHGLLKTNKSLRLYYLGPMFRAERPQAGRKRQFHQIGIELVNEAGVEADEECIAALHDFLNYVGAPEITLRLNHLGDRAYQEKVKTALRDDLAHRDASLCEDCTWRLQKNVMRILDCKNPSCQALVARSIQDKFPAPSEEFEALKSRLDQRKVKPSIVGKLVRGLDYYNGTVFEAASSLLGAQDALAGGGRYDQLYADLGGSPAPCTGFSIGMERLLTVLEKKNDFMSDKSLLYFAPLWEDFTGEYLERLQAAMLESRSSGYRVARGKFSGNLKEHLKNALQSRAKFLFIYGPDEFKSDRWTVKDLEKNEQRTDSWACVFSSLEGRGR